MFEVGNSLVKYTGGAIDGCASIPYLQAACLKERRIRFEVSAFGVGLASRRACI